MPTGPFPEPPPFRGFHPQLTLSKEEVLDLTTTLEEVIEDLAARELFDQAEQLARLRHHLVSRLER